MLRVISRSFAVRSYTFLVGARLISALLRSRQIIAVHSSECGHTGWSLARAPCENVAPIFLVSFSEGGNYKFVTQAQNRMNELGAVRGSS